MTTSTARSVIGGHELDAPPWSRVEGTLISAAQAVRRVYDHALESIDLSLTEASILAHLASSDSINQVDLARRLRTGRARIGVYVDELEREGAVKRKADPSDRRVWRVEITPQGRALWQRSVAVDRSIREVLRHGTNAEEREILDSLLLRIEANAQTLLGREFE